MKQLEQAVSSPWEIKGSGPQNQTPTQWTELTEEQQKKNEEKEKVEEKKNTWDFFLEFYPFGCHILRNTPLEQSPPREIYFPFPGKISATYVKGDAAASTVEHIPVMLFERYSVGKDYAWYAYRGLR